MQLSDEQTAKLATLADAVPDMGAFVAALPTLAAIAAQFPDPAIVAPFLNAARLKVLENNFDAKIEKARQEAADAQDKYQGVIQDLINERAKLQAELQGLV